MVLCAVRCPGARPPMPDAAPDQHCSMHPWVLPFVIINLHPAERSAADQPRPVAYRHAKGATGR